MSHFQIGITFILFSSKSFKNSLLRGNFSNCKTLDGELLAGIIEKNENESIYFDKYRFYLFNNNILCTIIPSSQKVNNLISEMKNNLSGNYNSKVKIKSREG
jgi:hypothetical protein